MFPQLEIFPNIKWIKNKVFSSWAFRTKKTRCTPNPYCSHVDTFVSWFLDISVSWHHCCSVSWATVNSWWGQDWASKDGAAGVTFFIASDKGFFLFSTHRNLVYFLLVLVALSKEVRWQKITPNHPFEQIFFLF